MGADEVFSGFNQDSSTPESVPSRLDSSTDKSIGQTLQNVTLEETQIDDHGGSDDAKDQYPLRPYAEDCAFYIRTGHCKFKLFCKFNHPVKRPNQGAKEKEKEKDKDEFVEQTSHIECKYFRTAAGCKFGEACRYRHSKEQTETPELNFLGLPIRQGGIVCPFYMRHGSCGYGATCRFHHPDPTDVEGSGSYNSTPTLQSMGGLNHSFTNHDGEYDPSLQLGTSQPTVASQSLHTSDETVPYLDDHLSKAPVYPKERPWQNNSPLTLDNSVKTDVSTYHQQQKELDEFPERPGQPDCDYFMKTGNCKFRSSCKYHHPKAKDSKLNLNTLISQKKFLPKPFYPREKAWKINSALGVDIFKKKTDVSGYHQPKIDVEEFPERPGQLDCAFFIKTGDCIYKSACRYHHPRNRVSTLPACALSDKGLPLRPDRKICWHYEQYGICKFGRSCLFDHPMNHCPSASPVGLDASLPSGSYAASFGGTRMAGPGAESEILISQSV